MSKFETPGGGGSSAQKETKAKGPAEVGSKEKKAQLKTNTEAQLRDACPVLPRTKNTFIKGNVLNGNMKIPSIPDVGERMRYGNRRENGNTANMDYLIGVLKLRKFRSVNLDETKKKIEAKILTQLDDENMYFRINKAEIPDTERRSLLPHTAGLLKTIGDEVNELMHQKGFPCRYRVRMHISSAYRTLESAKKTKKTEGNASKDKRGSAHEYGNSFDIQYTKLDLIDIESKTTSGEYKYEEISGGRLLLSYQGALAEVLNRMDLTKPAGKEKIYPRGLINVIKEGRYNKKTKRSTPRVYHVSDNGLR